jgi:hypothetical protein
VAFASKETPLALAVDEGYVYWENVGGALLDCPVAGCPGGVPTILAFNGTPRRYRLALLRLWLEPPMLLLCSPSDSVNEAGRVATSAPSLSAARTVAANHLERTSCPLDPLPANPILQDSAVQAGWVTSSR